MKLFSFEIFTPYGLIFSESIYQASVRSVSGDVSILAGHAPYLTIIDDGTCKIHKKKSEPPIFYNCQKGVLSVINGNAKMYLEHCFLFESAANIT